MALVCFTMVSLLIHFAKSVSFECQRDWSLILNSSHVPDEKNLFYLMHKFSGFSKNHLGDFHQCNSLKEAKFVVFSFLKSPANVQTFCGPGICTYEDYLNPAALGLKTIYDKRYEVSFPKEEQKEKFGKVSTGGVLVISFFAFLVVLSMAAGIFEEEKVVKGGFSEYFFCFSLKRCVSGLFARPKASVFYKHTGFLNANKVISIFFILMAHTFQYNFFISVLENIDEAYETTKTKFYSLIYGAVYAVDTFFWGIGFAFTYHSLEELGHKNSSVKGVVTHQMISRYLFLTATYMYLLFFFWVLQGNLGSGPVWMEIKDSLKDCDDYWYTNILYLNTFIPNFEGNKCLLGGWYIANDIQFLLVILLVSIVFYKYGEKLTWALLSSLLLLTVAASFFVSYTLNLSASQFSSETAADYYKFYYVKPYCRLAPCLFGITCGLICRACPDIQEPSAPLASSLIPKVKTPEGLCSGIVKIYEKFAVSVLSFLIGLCGFTLLLLINFDIYDNPGPDDRYTHWSPHENILFFTLEKTAFGLCLSLLLLPVFLGHLPLINSIMSSYPFVILGRLNFCVFLIHNNFIEIWYRRQKSAVFFDTQTNLLNSFLFFGICEILAIPLVLFIEMPVMNLFQVYSSRRED